MSPRAGGLGLVVILGSYRVLAKNEETLVDSLTWLFAANSARGNHFGPSS